ncbi:MAG: DUF1127 domain-containing protein [Proteobacteria bacterium]|nr:DUF1127 domain-containing protein [Pseudomonadota bacterium]
MPITLTDASSAAATRVVASFAASWRTLQTWRRRLRERDELKELDARQLRDVGLDPEMVKREARKPFWLP